MPYEDIDDWDVIKGKILDGERLALTTSFNDGQVDSRLQDLLTESWAAVGTNRPTIDGG